MILNSSGATIILHRALTTRAIAKRGHGFSIRAQGPFSHSFSQKCFRHAYAAWANGVGGTVCRASQRKPTSSRARATMAFMGALR